MTDRGALDTGHRLAEGDIAVWTPSVSSRVGASARRVITGRPALR
jgi:hypothetical protein